MRERAALLNIVAELRGRLDELEAMIQTAPDHAIISPASYDEDGIVDLTPAPYRSFRTDGLAAPLVLSRYEAFQSFTQFGAPQGSVEVELSAFDLSELHKLGPDPAFGLRFQPQSSAAQTFFTYEFIVEAEGLTQYQWLEWVVKLSLERQHQCFTQFIVDGEGFAERLDVGTASVSDYPAFRHIRLDRARLLEAAAGRPMRRLRLTISTGGIPMAMDLFGLALYGRV